MTIKSKSEITFFFPLVFSGSQHGDWGPHGAARHGHEDEFKKIKYCRRVKCHFLINEVYIYKLRYHSKLSKSTVCHTILKDLVLHIPKSINYFWTAGLWIVNSINLVVA